MAELEPVEIYLNPTNDNIEYNNYNIEIITNIIENILFLLSFSLKKIYPSNTLNIGIIK